MKSGKNTPRSYKDIKYYIDYEINESILCTMKQIQSYADMISAKHKNGIFPQEIDDILWKTILNTKTLLVARVNTPTYHRFSDS